MTTKKKKELQRLGNKLESATDKAKKECLDVTRTWNLGVMIYCKWKQRNVVGMTTVGNKTSASQLSREDQQYIRKKYESSGELHNTAVKST